MINFIPEKLKKNILLEHKFRVFSVFFVSFFIVMIFIIFLLVPAYTLSIARKVVIKNQLALVKNTTVNYTEDSLNKVKDINEIVKILSVNVEVKKPGSELLKQIISLKGNNIKISSISFDIDTSQNIKISMKGFSSTRESLTKYVKELKNTNLFSDVDLPVSNLVKSSDIDFTIGLTVKK